jgi:NADPH:quinone reductase-like Zn-dependent oxidoreductase
VKAVRFDEYGGVDVLKVVDVPRPMPGTAQVLVQVKAAGAGYVQLALGLGVEPSRIDTVVNFEAVARYGVNAEGSAEAATASVLAELAGLIAAGELELPIAAAFPLDRVQDVYRRLGQGHVLGKIVLLP